VADYSDRYDPDTHMDRWYTDATAAAIVQHVHPGDEVIELGCATGRMSAVFAAAGAAVTGIDRSAVYLAKARERVPGGVFVQWDVEQWAAVAHAARHVVVTNVLHELFDPAGFVRLVADGMPEGGLLHVSLQNPWSLHRLVGGGDGYAVTPEGRALGTRELFSADDLATMGTAAGLTLEAVEGIMLKPYPNSVMERLPDDVLAGLIEAGKALPGHCSMNYLRFARTPMLAHNSGSSSSVTSASTSSDG